MYYSVTMTAVDRMYIAIDLEFCNVRVPLIIYPLSGITTMGWESKYHRDITLQIILIN